MLGSLLDHLRPLLDIRLFVHDEFANAAGIAGHRNHPGWDIVLRLRICDPELASGCLYSRVPLRPKRKGMNSDL